MDDSSIDIRPEGERWDPLGAPNDTQDNEQLKENSYEHECTNCVHSSERLKSLEDEQDVLNSSLLALTTHFAQVQFRLRQIVSAPSTDKEDLLKSLEEFAFRGIPDVQLCAVQGQQPINLNEKSLIKAKQGLQCQQKELINQLKYQLKELESYAYEIGEAGLPQDVLLERQKVILDELRSKINLEIDELQPRQMTIDELRHQVNTAVGNIVSPLKMKEHLVNQLKTQVADLERFITFLQQDMENKHCTCHKSRDLKDSIHMVKRAAALLQMFAVVQFGCGSGLDQQMRKQEPTAAAPMNSLTEMRTRLQMAVACILEMGSTSNTHDDDTGNYSSDTEDSVAVVPCNVKLTHAVRKKLAICLRDLMQHGLMATDDQMSLVPFMGCFSKKSHHMGENMHVWDLILEYYSIKNGEYFNTTPARKLSQSYNLDIVGGSAISNKQSLLSTIGSIISIHTPYKRSNDSHFKAFVCAALNCNKLVTWLKLLYQCRQLVKKFYQPWSYAIQSGFQDTLQCLDVLTPIKFDLPVDLSVRQFQNIKDVFT